MGAATAKQFLLLDNRPILVHSLQVFEDCRPVDGVYLVVNQRDLPLIQEEVLEAYKFNKIVKLVIGGRLRQDSVRNGLEAIDEPCDVVVVHDAHGLSYHRHSWKKRSLSWKCSTHHPCPARQRHDQGHFKGRVCFQDARTGSLWHVQTPQTFKYDLIVRAYREGVAKKLLGTTTPRLLSTWANGEGDRRIALQYSRSLRLRI